MKKIAIALMLLFTCLPLISVAQAVTAVAVKTECNCMGKYKPGKGTFYISWGYNKDYYTPSNIHFYNAVAQTYPNAGLVKAYDFTLQKIKAADRPQFDELFIRSLSIPQYSYRAGYYFNDKHNLGIEVNFDHSKYVMLNEQRAHLKGTINGKYYDVDTLISTRMLKFEHTNGANFLMLNFLKRQTLLKSANEKQWLSLVIKAGGGIVIPKTDVTLWGERLDNKFHIAGYVTGIDIGLRYDFYKHFFLEASGKGVFANYLDVLTVGNGQANHYFFAYEWLAAVGLQFPL